MEKIIVTFIFLGMFRLSELLYHERIKRKEERLRTYVLLQYCSIFVILLFINICVYKYGYVNTLHITVPATVVWLTYEGIACIVRMVTCYRVVLGNRIKVLVKMNEKFNQQLIDTTPIKEKEYTNLKNQVTEILNYIKEKSPKVPDGALEFELRRFKGKYRIRILYYHLITQTEEEYRRSREELNCCFDYLSNQYELKRKSKNDREQIVIHIKC